MVHTTCIDTVMCRYNAESVFRGVIYAFATIAAIHRSDPGRAMGCLLWVFLGFIVRSELWLPPLCALFQHRVIHDRKISRVKKNPINETNFPYICYMTPTCINPLPYCMHYVTCVKCIQEILVFHSSLTFKAGSCHGAGSVVPGGTHNDNFRCRHWRRDWHRGSSGFSVFVHLFKR